MRHASLFSGIGGFDLAAEWMGWENVFHCEWMEFPRKVLDYYWPGADSYTDICKTDFKKYANTIDILTGGFPCQPFSLAGKRKGTDDERYLWGEMLRAVQEIKPTYVIAENVFGITNIDGGLVFEQVCLDLEAQGYEVQPFIIAAAAKNAPHRRDRCWFIAQNPMFSRCVHGESEQERAEVRKQRNTCTRSSDGIYLSKGNATDTDSNGFNQCNGNNEKQSSKRGKYAQCHFDQSNVNGNTTNTKRKGLERLNRQWQRCSKYRAYEGLFIGSKIKFNVTNPRCSKWKDRIHGEKQKRQTAKFGNSYTKFGRFTKFPTQSPVCSGNDGLPTKLDGITFPKWRNESIKGYGNAIVPQVAYEIFKQLQPTANCDNL
jgi:DNA (cytosine-5)-methyltransferase 1